MKTLLVIGYVWPEPNSSAAGSRMLQLLNTFLQQGYQITYASPAQTSEHAIVLSELNIRAVNIEINDPRFDEFIIELQPNIVLFDRFMMEEQFAWRVEKHCPRALKILDTEDLHCLRFARQKMAKANPKMVIKDVDNNHLYNDQAKREIAAILRCDLSIMISEYEMTLLKERFKVDESLLIYIPFMLTPLNNVHFNTFDQRAHFVSIGNFRHEPNWDAVLCLKQHIWPLIRKQLPQAQLHIYGAYPPKKATQLHNEKQGFLVKGWVDDAKAMLSNARVLLSPLRFGAGLKGKFIDAAECGLPCVTTSIGSEGLFTDDNTVDENARLSSNTTTLLSTDNFDTFAQHAIELYSNNALWLNLQKNCPEWLKQRFDESKYQTLLMQRINDINQALSKHRQDNFLGSMLLHHSMKSTQYMSQWIEAKNKLVE
ncbi:glycosyltransferase family 4 protein [Shewanella surugensis]|uniref:Glycosyltransferase family 4 protein n=1 Tax=Shewanella surugensis TaxID=212020 RepID=A0ABT0LD66_9GAMM|nr:glycosyltransferase family 4 protein [Shewanella surugensis]MCL1125624.1 glycosyltransferase family 4 protein [Shewanella surugensis]